VQQSTCLIVAPKRILCCVPGHSRATLFTSSAYDNRWHLKASFRGQNKIGEDVVWFAWKVVEGLELEFLKSFSGVLCKWGRALCDKGKPCKSFPFGFFFCEFQALFLFAAYHNSLDFEDQVRSWSGACGICGGKSGTCLVLKGFLLFAINPLMPYTHIHKCTWSGHWQHR